MLSRFATFPLAAGVVLSFAVNSRTVEAQKQPLTVEAIYAHGPLVPKPPDQLDWSPDGKHLAYLDGDDLMEVNPSTGSARVLLDAARMRRFTASGGSEQDRDHRARYGMASFLWAPDSAHLLFDAGGQLWLYDLRRDAARLVASTGIASGDDPKFSPDGQSVSFAGARGLTVVSLRKHGAATVAVAPTDDAGSILNGAVDWVYAEELDVRSNVFWSPDSQKIAYLQMNEAAVPRYPLADWIPVHAQVDWQRYPQPGDPNPSVRVGVASATGGKTLWMRIPLAEGGYIPRFGWVDRNTVWIETLSRDQKHRILFFADAASGHAQKELEIDDERFFEDGYDVSVGDGAIVLTSWQDGHTHLYLERYDPAHPLAAKAAQEMQLTRGDFDVSAIYSVDAARGLVTYASNEGDPQQQQIWQVSFNGERRRLSGDAGFHDASFAPGGAAFADTYSTRTTPPVVRLCGVASEPAPAQTCRVFWQTRALDGYPLHSPVQLAVQTHDGTTLYATLLLPPGATAPASVPLIVNPYGGPGAQDVLNQWSNKKLFDQVLVEHGFAVLHADNRGTSGRGRIFAQAAFRNFGAVQFDDQRTVINAALKKFPQLDPQRLGWWGWSWGGSFTLYAMTHSDRFRAGVAVAPVTDWRDYDSIYTERYLGLPAEDAAAYRDFSAVNRAAQLKGRLLLAHGTGDDNVHLENTVQFVQALIEAGIPYDLQIYPRKTHSIAGAHVRMSLYNRILAHFETYLQPAPSGTNGK